MIPERSKALTYNVNAGSGRRYVMVVLGSPWHSGVSDAVPEGRWCGHNCVLAIYTQAIYIASSMTDCRRYVLLANRLASLASGWPAHRRRDCWQAGVVSVHPHDPIGSPASPASEHLSRGLYLFSLHTWRRLQILISATNPHY